VPELHAIPGVRRLWGLTAGDPRVRVAAIDGPPDLAHPCFEGAAVEVVPCGWAPLLAYEDPEDNEHAREHGTWTAGVLVGGHHSESPGLAPGCTLLAVPGPTTEMGFSDPLTVARGIEAACAAGAHVIVLQVAMPSASRDVDGLLKSVIRDAHESGALLVFPAGNDDAEFPAFPQLLPEVMLVGAYDDDGVMFKFSSWDFGYERHGLVAPGGNISAAQPGGGLSTHKGTCCSAAVVGGVAALLLSLQLERTGRMDPHAVGEALLRTARPCTLEEARGEPGRCLGGKLDVAAATDRIQGGGVAAVTARVRGGRGPTGVAAPAAGTAGVVTSSRADEPVAVGPRAYALGSLGYDFGTQARRDSFHQLMAPAEVDGTVVPANPHSPRQLLDHLREHPSEAEALIWTLSIELTPIYAIRPVGANAPAIYELLTGLLDAELAEPDDVRRIERVALPGRLPGATVKLFSGQIVPVMEVEQTRAIGGWPTVALSDAALAQARGSGGDDLLVAQAVRELLTHIRYELRNLGVTAGDRALNYAITAAFQETTTLAAPLAAAMALDAITVQRPPICRNDSDCWDVTLSFFDPENLKRARRVSRHAIDVGELVPVALGPVRTWSQAAPRKKTAVAATGGR
jgi:PatG C-terminal/Subtilase family